MDIKIKEQGIDIGSLGISSLFQGSRDDLLMSLKDRLIKSRCTPYGLHYYIIATKDNTFWLYKPYKGGVYKSILDFFDSLNLNYELIELCKENPKRPSYLKVVPDKGEVQ